MLLQERFYTLQHPSNARCARDISSVAGCNLRLYNYNKSMVDRRLGPAAIHFHPRPASIHLQEPGVLGRRGCLHSTGTEAPAFDTASYIEEPFGRVTARPLTVMCICSSLAGAAAAALLWL